MNTGQKYEPATSGASPHPVSPLEIQNEQQKAFLREMLTNDTNRHYLFAILRSVEEQIGGVDPTAAINAMFSKYVSDTSLNLSETKNRYYLREIMALLAFLTELNSHFYCFNQGTDYINTIRFAEEGGGCAQ